MQGRGRGERSARVPLDVMALATMYGFLLCLYAGDTVLFGGGATALQSLECRVAVLLGTAGAIAFENTHIIREVCGTRWKRGLEVTLDVVAAVLLLVPAATALLIETVGFTWGIIVLWVLYGCPCSRLYMRASALLCHAERGRAAQLLSLATGVGALLFAAIVLVPFPANTAIASLLPVLSYVLYRVNFTDNSQGRDTARPDSPGLQMFSRTASESFMVTFVACIGVGIAIQIALDANAQMGGLVGSALTGAAVFVSSVAVAIDNRKRRVVNEMSTQRYLYVLIFVPLAFAVPLRGTALVIVGSVMLLLLWGVLIVGAATEAETAHSESLRAELALSRGWILSVAGIAIGMVLAYVGCVVFAADPLVFYAEVAVFGAVVLIAYATYAGPRRVSNVEEAVPQVKPSPPGMLNELQVLGNGGQLEGPFRRKCNIVADYYGLSPRQRQVFMLLVRGRNRKFIQDELVVSRGTVDTHTYNVYRKTNVHSRQELIDLVEAFDEEQVKKG